MSHNYRQTWATINLDYVLHNYNAYAKIASDKTIIPVIKANAYGHGVFEVCQVLYDKGIRLFAVSLLEEALEIKHHFNDIDVLIMGAIQKDQLDICAQEHLIFTLYDEDLYHAVMMSHLNLRMHLKYDSGMSRYGVSDQNNVIQMIEKLQNKPNIRLEGIYTHFATANAQDDFYHKQLNAFNALIEALKEKPPIIHASNSSSIRYNEVNMKHTTHARLGIGLYGLTLDDKPLNLKPVMSLLTKVIQIKHLKKGDFVGYGITYCAQKDEIIALLPIGYADGFIRKNKHGWVLINNKTYQIVGNICMDTIFIKVDETVHKGDTVTLFGTSLTTDEVAKRLDTINYEVVTNIQHRVPRIYIKDGKQL